MSYRQLIKMHNVYLIQPAHATMFEGHESYWLPYSVGCLWSYASQNQIVAENFNLAGLIYKRLPIDQIISTMDTPSVAAFSCYVWNYEYCKKLAQAIKHKWPDCVIVFGGPQVTKKPYEHSFFKKHPYIDTIVNGEGEPAFLDILLSIRDSKPIKKVSSFTRMEDLNYPSPYSSGVFNKIVNDNPEYHWQAVLETNRGCPYSCTFCDWGSLTYAKVLKFAEQRVIDDITWMSNNRVAYMFIADANFGMLYDRDKKFAQHLNQLQISKGFPKVVIAQWAKNAKHKILEIAKIFFNGDSNRGFTVSVQSMNDQVLDAIKRKNMEISDLKSMLEECFKNNIPAYTEMILGLPYETYESWKQNHGLVLEAGQHNSADVWLTQLIENSELNTYEQRTLHEIKSIAVPKLVTGIIPIENDVQEIEVLITSTKYMPFDDLVKSYMFSYIIMTYHYSGWTHLMSRFLRKYNNVSYHDFYSLLEEKITDGPADYMLTKEFYRIKKFISDFLSGEADVDPSMGKDQHGALWHSLKFLSIDRQSTFNEIFNILNNDYCNLDEDLYQELKFLQMNYMYDYDKQYPQSYQFKYNIYDYIFNNTDKLEGPCELEFWYPFSYVDKNHFLEKLYFGRRTGTMKTRIRLK